MSALQVAARDTLNHCRGFMGMGRSRSKYRRPFLLTWEIFLEQEIPGDLEKNHPDLVVINSSLEKAIVVDVTIPFEGEENSLQAARTAKETKYSALKAWLQTKYKGGDGCIYRGAELMGP